MELQEKEKLPQSPGEILASMEWQKIIFRPRSIWFKSYPLTDQQYNVLEKMLINLLDAKFLLSSNEIFTTKDDVSSFTIRINSKHKYWGKSARYNMEWFSQNPKYLFFPLPQNEQMQKEKTLIEQWQERAAAVGLTLADLCRAGNIDRSTLERWKDKPPKAVAAYQAIESELEKQEGEKNKDDKAEFDLREYQEKENF